MRMRSRKSKSYRSQPNMNSKKRVIHGRNETFRRSQRLKSNDEGRVIEPHSNLKENNTSKMSNNLFQTVTDGEQHFPCKMNDKTLKCKICSKTFSYQTNLKRHYRVHLRDKSFASNECQTPFESGNHLKRYINYPLRNRIDSKVLNAIKLSDYQTKEVKTNPANKLLFDSTRVQAIRQKIQLKNSTAIKKNRSFSCSACKKSFKWKDGLNRHSITHTRDKPFGCDTCEMSFYRKDHLKRHLRTHTEDKPFSCGTCKKAFRQKEHLTRHSNIHTGDKPFSCGTCKKLFSRKDHLKNHFSVHMKDKAFSGVTNNKTFTLKSHRKNRLRIPLSGKPFSCYKCNKTFKHKNHLKLHNRIHLKKDTFACKMCVKTFKKYIYLQRHLIIHSRKNGFARNNNENIFKCNIGVKRRLDGKYKPLDQKTCKKMCNGRNEMKNFAGICTRSKSLSSENYSKGLNPKYEQLSTICTGAKINCYESSFPDAILEANNKLEEKRCTDLKKNSLTVNTNLIQTIENEIMVHTRKENSQECCYNETKKSNNIELNKIKGRNTSTFSEICTRSKSFSNKSYYEGFDHKDNLGSTTCTVSRSNLSDCPALDKIWKDNSQTEEKHCTEVEKNCLEGNALLAQTVKNEPIDFSAERENCQNCYDNETKNLTHIKLNKKKKRKFSGYSEFCSRFKSLSIKTREKDFNPIYNLFNTRSTDSRSIYFDWRTPKTIEESSRQTEGQVGIHLAENYLTGNSHLKQKIENEPKMHINTDIENFLNKRYNQNTAELNLMKRTSLSEYLIASTRNTTYSMEKCRKDFNHELELFITACTNSRKFFYDYFSFDYSSQKDNSKLEDNVSVNVTGKSVTDNTPQTQTEENKLMIYSKTKKDNSQDYYDNETNKPNQIQSNEIKGTKKSAYSVICTRSKSFSSKKFEKSFDLKDKVTTSTDSKIKSSDCSVLDKTSKVNKHLKVKDCADLAENSITGNASLKQTTEKELTINLDKKKENSQKCYNETKNSNRTEMKEIEGINISAYSTVITRSKSLSNKNSEEGLDCAELANTTCTDSLTNSSDNSILGKICKENAQLEEKVYTELLENCFVDNSHLEQTMQVCCDNEAKSPNNIELNQMKEVNTTVYSIICSYCEEKFKRHGDLQRHLRVHRSSLIPAIKTQDLK